MKVYIKARKILNVERYYDTYYDILTTEEYGLPPFLLPMYAFLISLGASPNNTVQTACL